MKTVNIQDADLSSLVEEAAAGEEIIIAKSGKPVARIVSLEKPDFRKTFGMLKGKIWIDDDKFDALPPLQNEKSDLEPGRLKHLIRIKDNFDDPLPPEIAEAFGIDS